MSDKLHPSVREFKEFLQRHPKLVEEVRKNGRGWQEYYEKWALLGEDDPFWDKYKEEKSSKTENKKSRGNGKKEMMERLIQMSENIDMDKLQTQVENINGAISTVQELLGQFQSSNHSSQQSFDPSSQNNRPFGGLWD
ncbi:hypothetical protein FH966_11665 [Lentibacillus cibarius]|uniref:Cytosolic protein n=1 Tax=Lentibacillus cibarius TaxID=2583219 RepID=A0A549YK82_9BACI|nr:spore coat protein YlbD [Lentibacillus cibarius]TRM12288.1 hypothetical protein FH966_11665 [Lentibacillus cibarius]